MKASYNKLQEYFSENLPEPNKVAELLTFHSYEVEDIEEMDRDYIFDIDVLPNRAGDSSSEDGVAKELSAVLNISLKKEPFPKKKRNPYKVGVSTDEVDKLLGTDISEKEIENIFKRFNFEYKKVKPIDEVLKLAPTFEGTPYKYGASVSHDAPESFDCSSFASYLFAQAGISIPRMSVDQYFYGEEVKENDLKSGDIVFSVGKTKNIHHKSIEFMKGMEIKDGVSHCGIYIEDGSVIHASGKENFGKVVKEKLSESNDFKDIIGYRRMAKNDERFVVTVPFERLDLKIKEDLIEEIGRIYGYENIKSKLPEKSEKAPKVNKKFYYENKIKNFLANEGFSEVYTYSFRDSGDVEIEKPFASDKNFLRKDLFYGLNDAEQRNIKNIPLLDEDRISILEIGNVFTKSKEHTSLGISHSGGSRKVEEIINRLSEILSIKIEGTINLNVFETNLDELIKKLEDQPSSYEKFEKPAEDIKYKTISSYPFVLRDIAMWVPLEKPVGKTGNDIFEIIKKEAGDLLVNIKLFDAFRKDDKVSYAFNLVFQSQEKTLSDEEVNVVMEKITKALNTNINWQVRD